MTLTSLEVSEIYICHFKTHYGPVIMTQPSSPNTSLNRMPGCELLIPLPVGKLPYIWKVLSASEVSKRLLLKVLFWGNHSSIKIPSIPFEPCKSGCGKFPLDPYFKHTLIFLQCQIWRFIFNNFKSDNTVDLGLRENKKS